MCIYHWKFPTERVKRDKRISNTNPPKNRKNTMTPEDMREKAMDLFKKRFH